MADTKVESVFVRRVAAAARAAWWTLLVGVILVGLQFTAYVISARCGCVWGWMVGVLGLDESVIRLVALQFLLAVRFLIILILMAAVFLSIWTCRLRRTGAE